ncbi:META domain-containing protein [Patescibacteria group bacterium]|nr:META domain-containing protein [Patescibacteria group bacterium]
MQKIFLVFIGVVAVVLLGFFALNAFIYNEKQADTSMIAITDTSWTWTTTLLAAEGAFTPNEPERFVLTFETDGRFGSSTDCNTMGGNYTMDGASLSFGEIISTKMYCEGSQEATYAEQLGNVVAYVISEEGSLMLTLQDDQGTMVFVQAD